MGSTLAARRAGMQPCGIHAGEASEKLEQNQFLLGQASVQTTDFISAASKDSERQPRAGRHL